MTTIIDIAEQIKLKENKESNSKANNALNWKPVECTDYTVPPFSIPTSRSKKSTRDQLAKVLAIIDSMKYTRLAHGCTIMPIASTNQRLIKICGSQRNVSNLIQFMLKIGLLSVEDQHYQFNASIEKYNKAKTYRYYYDNEEKIKEYCRNKDIHKYETKNILTNTVVEKFRIIDFDNQQVRFSSKLHLTKPEDYSVSNFETYLLGILYKNYPQLAHYQQLADYLNETYYADDPHMAISFTPHFTWSKSNKYIRKISIRATNAFVAAKKEKTDDDNFHGYYRDDILNEHGLNLEKDVNSSVPRITRSLNTGKWISEDIDIYKVINDEYIKLKCQKENSSCISELQHFNTVRSAIKDLHMRVYFDSESRVSTNIQRAMAKVENKAEVDAEIKLLRNAVIAAEGGNFYDGEIFFHESCIYMDVLKDLLEDGYKVWQCYDAWYASKEGVTQDTFEKHVTELVARKATEYINHRNMETAA